MTPAKVRAHPEMTAIREEQVFFPPLFLFFPSIFFRRKLGPKMLFFFLSQSVWEKKESSFFLFFFFLFFSTHNLPILLTVCVRKEKGREDAKANTPFATHNIFLWNCPESVPNSHKLTYFTQKTIKKCNKVWKAKKKKIDPNYSSFHILLLLPQINFPLKTRLFLQEKSSPVTQYLCSFLSKHWLQSTDSWAPESGECTPPPPSPSYHFRDSSPSTLLCSALMISLVKPTIIKSDPISTFAFCPYMKGFSPFFFLLLFGAMHEGRSSEHFKTIHFHIR